MLVVRAADPYDAPPIKIPRGQSKEMHFETGYSIALLEGRNKAVLTILKLAVQRSSAHEIKPLRVQHTGSSCIALLT